MQIDPSEIPFELERLAQAFPWDTVEIDTRRAPEGKYSFVAYIPSNSALGIESSIYSGGETIQEAVDGAVKQAHARDPQLIKERMIRELESKLELLRKAQFTIPPYIPNRELCERNPELQPGRRYVSHTVDV